MGNPEYLAVLSKGVEEWNRWRKNHPEIRIDLSGADLAGSDLVDANFNAANLRKADFNGSDLRRAALSAAQLNGSNLSGVDLRGCPSMSTDFSEANLSSAKLNRVGLYFGMMRGANLNACSLKMTNLCGADLVGAKFHDTLLEETIFADTDLRNTEGLDTCVHQGPSTLDHRTLIRSGSLPLSFIRGCGLPENLIEYLPSIVGSAIEYYSLFISYSTADQDFAERLHSDLQAKGIRCWFAPHDIKGGRKIQEQIDEAIRLHDKLLLILSPSSMESQWVETEISKARKREVRDKARVLFPVRLAPFETLRDWECFDADTGKDSAREIREYFIPDFSNWKNHDSYQPAFDRLVRDLQAHREATGTAS